MIRYGIVLIIYLYTKPNTTSHYNPFCPAHILTFSHQSIPIPRSQNRNIPNNLTLSLYAIPYYIIIHDVIYSYDIYFLTDPRIFFLIIHNLIDFDWSAYVPALLCNIIYIPNSASSQRDKYFLYFYYLFIFPTKGQIRNSSDGGSEVVGVVEVVWERE